MDSASKFTQISPELKNRIYLFYIRYSEPSGFKSIKLLHHNVASQWIAVSIVSTHDFGKGPLSGILRFRVDRLGAVELIFQSSLPRPEKPDQTGSAMLLRRPRLSVQTSLRKGSRRRPARRPHLVLPIVRTHCPHSSNHHKGCGLARYHHP